MRTLLYFLVLAAFPAAGSPASLTPEATFDLYARTVLQNDADSQHESMHALDPHWASSAGSIPMSLRSHGPCPANRTMFIFRVSARMR